MSLRQVYYPENNNNNNNNNNKNSNNIANCLAPLKNLLSSPEIKSSPSFLTWM